MKSGKEVAYSESFVNPHYTKRVYRPVIEDLIGRTFTKVRVNEEDTELCFENDEETFTFYHSQDCCETVSIEDIVGDLQDLVGSAVLVASEKSREEGDYGGSCTWTFYKFATIKGYVDIRWFGESNGYYSEKVDLMYKKKKAKYNDT